MTPYLADEVIDGFRGDYAMGIFFRLGTEPPLHIAFSPNEVPITIPGLDAPGTVYIGGGAMPALPELQVLINGLADRVTFEINGVKPEHAALIFPDGPEVLGKLVTVGVAALDKDWQPLTQIIPLWTGTGDVVAMKGSAEPDKTKPRTVGLQLICGAGDTSRAALDLSTYTNSSQQRRYPTDTFFQRMPRYIQQLIIVWPRFN